MNVQKSLELTILNRLVDAASDAVIVVDDRNMIVYANRGVESVFGWSPNSLLNQTLDCLLPPDAAARHWNFMKAFAGNGTESRQMGRQAEIRGLRKSGEEFPAEISIVAETIDGHLVFAAIVRDITERKRAQEELSRAHVAAVSANDAKDRFLATMSHELRTPLNAIIGFSEVMKQQIFGPLSERYSQYAADISKSGSYLLAHIQGILEITRSHGGEIELHEVCFVLRALLEDCIREVSIASSDITRDIRITDCDGSIRLRADRVKCYQILTNILWNAVKFSRKRSPIILSASVSDTDGALVIAIEDQGIGIPKGKLEMIRKPFVKLANPSHATNHKDGIGLGLHIVQTLMEAHGGSLDIDSAPDQGTRVSVTFPASRVFRTDSVDGN